MNNALRRQPKKKLSDLGIAIQHYQRELGYSDSTLATLMFCDRAAVHRHKYGDTPPGYNKLLDYARVLKINLSSLILKSEEI